MKKIFVKHLLVPIALLVFSSQARAQFYEIGNDPWDVKWSEISTNRYKFIYPQGLDSLAFQYARYMEQVATPVGYSIGYEPNSSYKTKLPVILHPYSSNSNGVVAWAPRRMELYTTPDPFAPDPIIWPIQLAIHESRHVSQMQPYTKGSLKWGHYIIGDFFPSVGSAMFGGISAMEGDAVVAETSLTRAGRGRNADFLEYFRACYAQGDWRDYYKWRYGSLNDFTPDYYKIGYFMEAGLRNFLDYQKWPRYSQSKIYKTSFETISKEFAKEWDKNAVQRGPFMDFDQLSSFEKRFVSYSSLCSAPNGLYAIRQGLDENPSIVFMDFDCCIKKFKSLSYSTSRIRYSCDQLFWSEIVSDPRWELRSYSIIKKLDCTNGTETKLTKNTRYFNPSVCADGSRIAVSEYLVDGSSALVVLDANDGSVLKRHYAPDGIQIVESCWIDDKIYVSGLTMDGMSIYDTKTWTPLTKALPVKIKELDSHQGEICFVSDYNGVDELYKLNINNGSILQLTNSRQGSNSHCFVNGDLFFSMLSKEGRMICSVPSDKLSSKEVQFLLPYENSIARSLSSKEAVLPDYNSEVAISPVKQYNRLDNSFHFHSWAPAYINTDVVDNLSKSSVYKNTGLGASVFFQNELSTLKGMVAYSAWTKEGGFENGGHIKLDYSGLYPKMEFSVNVYDNPSFRMDYYYDQENKKYVSDYSANSPARVNAKFKTYIPLKFSDGIWSRGVVPQFTYSVSNNIISYAGLEHFSNTLLASVRTYMVQNIPSSCLFPRWGLGAEAGVGTYPGMSHIFNRNVYGMAYAYLPGFAKTHGTRISIIHESLKGEAPFVNQCVNVAPRGASELNSELSRYKNHGKFSFDYTFPFLSLDWSRFARIAYVKNLEFTAHYDLSYYKYSKGSGTLSSTGCDLVVKLGNLFCMPYDTRIGVSYDFNHGDFVTKAHSFGFIFSIDI